MEKRHGENHTKCGMVPRKAVTSGTRGCNGLGDLVKKIAEGSGMNRKIVCPDVPIHGIVRPFDMMRSL